MSSVTKLTRATTMDRYTPPHSFFITDPHHDAPPPAPSTPVTKQLPATMTMAMMGWQDNRQGDDDDSDNGGKGRDTTSTTTAGAVGGMITTTTAAGMAGA